MAKPVKLLDQVRAALRSRHYSYQTEKAYVHWTRRFILYHNKRHPRGMGARELEAFLSHLAVDRRVSASTQNQALNALLFLYRTVLQVDLPWLRNVVRAKRPQRLPVVLSQEEVGRVLAHLDGAHWLMASLLYGAGLRLNECLRLRVKDLDFDYRQIIVRDGKGGKDRSVPLPGILLPHLESQLHRVKELREMDRDAGRAGVSLPHALERKYPSAPQAWAWQYVFPAAGYSRDPQSGQYRRHHYYPQTLQRAVSKAVKRAAITKPASCHTFRHCFATHLLEAGYDIRTVQELMGHASVTTTQIYTHVVKRGGNAVVSPVDTLWALARPTPQVRDEAATYVAAPQGSSPATAFVSRWFLRFLRQADFDNTNTWLEPFGTNTGSHCTHWHADPIRTWKLVSSTSTPMWTRS